MGCIAQVLQNPATGTLVKPSEGSCCCDNIITEVDNVYVLMKQINVTILRGKVCCGVTPSVCPTGAKCTTPPCDHPVDGAIVVATVTVLYESAIPTTNYYVGITNDVGEYSICVPAPEGDETVTYEVQAYCCCSCNGDCCEVADCTCNCNGD